MEEVNLAVKEFINGLIDKPDDLDSYHRFHSSLWREVETSFLRSRRSNYFVFPSDFVECAQFHALKIVRGYLNEEYEWLVTEMTDSSKPNSIGEFWFKQRSQGVEWWVEVF